MLLVAERAVGDLRKDYSDAVMQKGLLTINCQPPFKLSHSMIGG